MFTLDQNRDIAEIQLNTLVKEGYDAFGAIGQATIMDERFFKSKTFTSGAFKDEKLSGGGGKWKGTGELEAINEATPFVDRKVTVYPKKWTNSISYSIEIKMRDQHETIAAMVRQFGLNARISQEDYAWGLYRNAFTSTLTRDGQPLISATHDLMDGGNASNLIIGALSFTTLNNSVVSLVQQPSEEGLMMALNARDLLVPTALYAKALQTVQSILIPDNTDASINTNAINTNASRYTFSVSHTPYIGAIAGGSDTAWYVLTPSHSVCRRVEMAPTFYLQDYKLTKDQSFTYVGFYTEEVHANDWQGIVGSTGL